MTEQPDFRDLVAALNAHGVEFVIVGAFALAYHACPRATGDIDLMTSLDGVTAEQVWAERVAAPFADQPAHYMSKRCLILNKKATGRRQDLADLETLE